MDLIEKAVYSASQAFPKGMQKDEFSSREIEREYLAELNGKRNLARTYLRISLDLFLSYFVKYSVFCDFKEFF